ncbi:MAG: NAD(+) diphosphatase [Hyphomicrobiaceae bacterium]|nr:NAD(+) diphosphatase [Hyphomicrobiaceae bacterium]
MFTPRLRASATLDRQSHKRGDEAYLEGLIAAPEAKFLVLAGHKPVIQSEGMPGGETDEPTGTIRWFGRDDMLNLGLPVTEAFFLGVDPADGGGRFAISVSEHRARNAPGAVHVMRPIVDLRTLAMQGALPDEDLSLLGMAKALAHWHDVSRCCGHCGGTTMVKDGGWRRQCWACGQQHFPRTDPVVIMLVVDRSGERCLLGHESRFNENMWSTLAGFLEPGEDIEHAVRREVFEEAGLRIGEVKFHSTQPWPFPHSLMIGCHAIAETTDIKIDPNEIVDARWFSRGDIQQMLEGKHPNGLWVPGKQAIARSLILAFANGEV